MRKKVAPNPVFALDASDAPDALEINATVDAIVNDIINNAVNIVVAKKSSCVPYVEPSLYDDNDDGMPHHKSSIITSSYYAQFV